MLDAKEQLIRLLRIQELAQGARAAHEVVESAPGRIEEIEARFRERNAEYVAVKNRYDEIETDQRARSTELATLEESRKKYMEDLMGVQNQREYAAMLAEIDAVKAKISEHEDVILKYMEEVETLKGELETHAEHIKVERESVEKERAEVEAGVAEARRQIERFGAERAQLESELPGPLVDIVKRLEDGRQGLFLARADDGTCQACFVRVRPQVHQEIKLASKIHYCSNCRRLLYFEPALKPAAETQEQTPDPSGVGG